MTGPAKHPEELLFELRDVRSLNQLFLVAALRDDFQGVRHHPHAEPADCSHCFDLTPDEKSRFYNIPSERVWPTHLRNWPRITRIARMKAGISHPCNPRNPGQFHFFGTSLRIFPPFP